MPLCHQAFLGDVAALCHLDLGCEQQPYDILLAGKHKSVSSELPPLHVLSLNITSICCRDWLSAACLQLERPLSAGNVDRLGWRHKASGCPRSQDVHWRTSPATRSENCRGVQLTTLLMHPFLVGQSTLSTHPCRLTTGQ